MARQTSIVDIDSIRSRKYSDWTIIKRLLADHDCASVLPRHAVADELGLGQLAAVPLADRALRQQVVLATSSQRPFTLAARTVAGLIPALIKAAVQP